MQVLTQRQQRAFRAGIKLIIVSLLFGAGVASAQSRSMLDVAQITDTILLAPSVQYLRHSADLAYTPAQILGGQAGTLQPLPGDELSFGYTTDKFWLLLDTINSSSEQRSAVLDTNIKFMEPLLIYSVSADNRVEEILRNDQNQPFATRPLPTPKLTLPLTWQPGEQKQLLIHVASGSGMEMVLELGAVENVIAKYASTRTFFALFSGILLTLILINLFHFYAVRRLAHLLYAVQEGAILLYMLHIDGLAFQYLWPGSPVWNAHATMVFGHLINLSASLFSISFLELRSRAPLLHRVATAIAIVSLIMLLITPLVETQFSNQVGLVISGLGSIILFATGVLIASRGYRPARYYVAGWLFMSGGAFVFGLAKLAIISLPFAPVISLRFGVLLEALILSYGLADQLKSLNDAAHAAKEQLLNITRQRLHEAQELVRLEQARSEAERSLWQKDLEIARARHDIRQPIYSLRLALLASQQKQVSSDTHQMISRALDHMEGLLEETGTPSELASSLSAAATYGDLLTQLQEEFMGEAISKGIALQRVDSRRQINVPVVPLKRVISNLLANALRHAGAKRILLGLRRRNHGVEILVVDNGRGLDAENTTTSGEGLGLGIVHALCEEHGWSVNFSSEQNRGTCFRIGLGS